MKFRITKSGPIYIDGLPLVVGGKQAHSNMFQRRQLIDVDLKLNYYTLKEKTLMSNCPDRLQLINATVTAGTSVTAIVAFTSVEHRDFYTLCNNILASSSGATGAELFSIQVGATGSTPAPVTYPVLNCLGENVQYGTLRAGMDLCLQFVSPDSTGTGSVPAHFRLKSPTCPLVLIPAGA